jgi:hypothetical protein
MGTKKPKEGKPLAEVFAAVDAADGAELDTGDTGVSEAVEVGPDELEGLTGSVRDKLQEWADKESAEDDIPQVWLYKYDHARHGKGKSLVWQGEEVPDENTVGITYGSGRYLVLMQLPKSADKDKRIKGYCFRCHESYDRLHEEWKAQQQKPAQPSPQSAGGNSLNEGLQQVAAIIQVIAPLIRQGQAPAGPSVDQAGALMLKTYEQVGTMLAKSQIETHKMLSDTLAATRDDGYDDDDQDDDEETEGGDIVTQLAKLAGEYLPTIIGKGPASSALAAVVKASPQLRKIRKSKGDMVKLVGYLDQLHGAEKVDKALAKIGIQRPAA